MHLLKSEVTVLVGSLNVSVEMRQCNIICNNFPKKSNPSTNIVLENMVLINGFSSFL